MPPRKKTTKTMKKSVQKLRVPLEKQSALSEEQIVGDQTINSATVIAPHPPVVKPDSAAATEGFNAKLRYLFFHDISEDKIILFEGNPNRGKPLLTRLLKRS